MVMLPPNSDWMPPTKLPTMERERTVMPRTTPRFRVIRYPGSSSAVVIMELSMGQSFQDRERALHGELVGLRVVGLGVFHHVAVLDTRKNVHPEVLHPLG